MNGDVEDRSREKERNEPPNQLNGFVINIELLVYMRIRTYVLYISTYKNSAGHYFIMYVVGTASI